MLKRLALTAIAVGGAALVAAPSPAGADLGGDCEFVGGDAVVGDELHGVLEAGPIVDPTAVGGLTIYCTFHYDFGASQGEDTYSGGGQPVVATFAPRNVAIPLHADTTLCTSTYNKTTGVFANRGCHLLS